MDLSNEKDRLIFFIVIILIVMAGGNFTNNIGVKKTRNWNFKGHVENVRYDIQGNPSITINGKDYDLYYTIWHFDVKIYKGDTLVKQKGDLRIKLIRQGARDTIYFNSRD